MPGPARRRRPRRARHHDGARDRAARGGRDPRPPEPDRSRAVLPDAPVRRGRACVSRSGSRSTAERPRARAASPWRPPSRTPARACAAGRFRERAAASSAPWASASSAGSRSTACRTAAPAWSSCGTGWRFRRGSLASRLPAPGPGLARERSTATSPSSARGRRGSPRPAARRSPGRARSSSTRGSRRADRSTAIGRGASRPRRRGRGSRACPAPARTCGTQPRCSTPWRPRTGSDSSPRRAPERLEVRAKRVILATGARELFLPFPGWTLPGVMGAAGAQALWKSGGSLRGPSGRGRGLRARCSCPWPRRSRRRAREVALVAEQASAGALLGFGASLWRAPGQARRGGALSRRVSRKRAIAPGPGSRRRWAGSGSRPSSSRRAPGGSPSRATWRPWDTGSFPNTELARLLGCDVRGGAVAVGETQETSVAGRLLRRRALRNRRRRSGDRRGADRGPRRGRPLRDLRRRGKAAPRGACAIPPLRRGPGADVRAAERAARDGAAGHDRLPLRGRAPRRPGRVRRARGRPSCRPAPAWAPARGASAGPRSGFCSAGIRIAYARPSSRRRSGASRRMEESA